MTKTFEKLFFVALITLSLGSLAEASIYSNGKNELYKEANIMSAAYATYTPQMAERGQRFYVGP